MTIFEGYQKILQRINLRENEEKYSHLVNSPHKTQKEQQLHNDILTMGMYIALLNGNETQLTTPKMLLESGCRILYNKIMQQLDECGWEHSKE